MRISDWSSDVCSSDLADINIDSEGFIVARNGRASGAKAMRLLANLGHDARGWLADLKELRFDNAMLARSSLPWLQHARGPQIDVQADELPLRKSVVWGQSVSVRVCLGGRRIIKKKKNNLNILYQ